MNIKYRILLLLPFLFLLSCAEETLNSNSLFLLCKLIEKMILLLHSLRFIIFEIIIKSLDAFVFDITKIDRKKSYENSMVSMMELVF